MYIHTKGEQQVVFKGLSFWDKDIFEAVGEQHLVWKAVKRRSKQMFILKSPQSLQKSSPWK